MKCYIVFLLLVAYASAATVSLTGSPLNSGSTANNGLGVQDLSAAQLDLNKDPLLILSPVAPSESLGNFSPSKYHPGSNLNHQSRQKRGGPGLVVVPSGFGK